MPHRARRQERLVRHWRRKRGARLSFQRSRTDLGRYRNTDATGQCFVGDFLTSLSERATGRGGLNRVPPFRRIRLCPLQVYKGWAGDLGGGETNQIFWGVSLVGTPLCAAPTRLCA